MNVLSTINYQIIVLGHILTKDKDDNELFDVIHADPHVIDHEMSDVDDDVEDELLAENSEEASSLYTGMEVSNDDDRETSDEH